MQTKKKYKQCPRCETFYIPVYVKGDCKYCRQDKIIREMKIQTDRRIYKK